MRDARPERASLSGAVLRIRDRKATRKNDGRQQQQKQIGVHGDRPSSCPASAGGKVRRAGPLTS